MVTVTLNILFSVGSNHAKKDQNMFHCWPNVKETTKTQQKKSPNLGHSWGARWKVFKLSSVFFYPSLTHSSVSSKSSRYLHSQTLWSRDLNFWENVHLSPCVTCHVSLVTCHMSSLPCHMSHVMCHMSCVTCHMSCVTNQIFCFFYKVVQLVHRGSVINRAYLV